MLVKPVPMVVNFVKIHPHVEDVLMDMSYLVLLSVLNVTMLIVIHALQLLSVLHVLTDMVLFLMPVLIVLIVIVKPVLLPPPVLLVMKVILLILVLVQHVPIQAVKPVTQPILVLYVNQLITNHPQELV